MFEYDYNPFKSAIFSAKQIPKLEEAEKEFKKLIKQRSPEAIKAASDFVLFRKYVCGHETFDHMLTWHHALNTGEDNKFLRGIAGENTCILSPRNFAKSSFLLQWVCWIIGTHAMQGVSLKILYISYVIDVARGKSRQMQAIIESDAYQEVFPMVKASKEKWSESEWAIDFTYAGLRAIDESYTLACSGLAGAINSKRCLTGDNLIFTQFGDIPIGDIVDGNCLGLKVLTYNHNTNKLEFRKVIAVSKRKETFIYSVNTRCGYKIRCTFDHKFYIPGIGYRQAQYLDIGDELLIPSGRTCVAFCEYERLDSFEYVYDIEVEDNHNFFANNVLVHNSHLIVFDDLIKNPSEAKNKKIQDKMMENYSNIIRFTKHDGARFVNLGTRMAKHDVYATTFVADNGWKVIKQSAIIKDGDGNERSAWEQGISLETLLQERIEDEESFLLQRQNEIPEVSSVGIKYHHIKFGWMPAKFERLVIGADTANSTDENSNSTAFVVLGIANDCIYVIDAFEARIQGSLKKIDVIYDLWVKRKSDCKHPAILAVDWNSHAMGLEGDLNTYIEDLHLDQSLDQDFAALIIEKIKSTGRGDKIDRIESHSYLFERGRVIFNRISSTSESGEDLLSKLVNEITDYNPMSHNDLMDALEVGLYVAREYVSSNLTVVV